MADSAIEWTDKVWNPVRGCRRVSPGCEHCYAERQAHRFAGAGQPYEGLTKLTKNGPVWTGEARFVSAMLEVPLRWRTPRRIFVNSMSDLFHKDITNEEIAAVFGVMAACTQHTFQVLTKRPERMLDWFRWVESEEDAGEVVVCQAARVLYPGEENRLEHVSFEHHAVAESWPLPNVWLGVSAEDQQRADERIPLLLQCPAAVRFVSAEPLVGPVELQRWLPAHLGMEPEAESVDWVIVGGESGVGARVCRLEWIESVVVQCRRAGVPVFVKQLGARPAGEWLGDNQPRCHVTDITVEPMQYRVKLNRTKAGVWKLGDRKGGSPSEWPTSLRLRQFPGGAP